MKIPYAFSATIAFIVSFGFSCPVLARDLVYHPVSPLFGGSPLNAAALPSLAAANNTRYLESPNAKRQRVRQEALTGNSSDPAVQFQRQITASLLSQIASSFGQQILGENARDAGTFSIGGTSVQFNRVGGQINIDITEATTGGRTNIQIPVPQF